MAIEKSPVVQTTKRGVLPRLGNELSEILERIMSAVHAGDKETAESLIAQAEVIRADLEAERTSMYQWSAAQKARSATPEQQ